MRPTRGRQGPPMVLWMTLLALASCSGGGGTAPATAEPPVIPANTAPAATPTATEPDAGSPPPAPAVDAGTAGNTPPPPGPGGPPALRRYDFTAQQSKLLEGGSGEAATGWNCTGTIRPEDQLGRLALVAKHFHNGCYTDGSYNHRNYQVERGTVAAAGSDRSYDAYRVHAPTHRASKFLGSRHVVAYDFPAKTDYTVYRVEAGSVAPVAKVAADRITPGVHLQLAIDATDIAGSAVFAFAPTSEPLDALHRLGAGVRGARIATTAVGELALYRYDVAGTPYDTRGGWNHGPGSPVAVYAPPRRFFPVTVAGGELAVIWQDQASKGLRVTRLASDGSSRSTVAVDNPHGLMLAAAAADGGDRLFFLLIEDGNRAGQNQAVEARLVTATSTGGGARDARLDTGASGLDMTAFGDSYSASMAYADGTLGVIVSRTMHRSSDGLNHQGAIAAVFDASSLALLANTGQTSGHSFDNVLTAAPGGGFVGVDLGDNYPRGVHLHRFDRRARQSAVVYSFKTQHGRSATSPAGRSYPAYPEISGGGTTYYKWSNDNRTYTELGGVVDDGTGYAVLFAGETHGGRALDNSRVGGSLNDPRNIGLVRVRRDFASLPRTGTAVADALVLSKGAVETGGYYTFGGSWAAQRNTGVIWLTDYRDHLTANASRVKVAGLPGGALLVLWEKWTDSHYQSTHALKVDSSGRTLAGPVELGPLVRLGRRDDPWASGSEVHLVAGNPAAGSLDVAVLTVK